MLKTFVFMNTLEANIRNTKSKGDVRALRLKGIVPAIIYGGSEQNTKVSISKKTPQPETRRKPKPHLLPHQPPHRNPGGLVLAPLCLWWLMS